MERERIAFAKSFCWAVFVIGLALSSGWKSGEKRRRKPPPKGGFEA